MVSQTILTSNKTPEIGTLVNATVSNVVPYGVYLLVDGGFKGLMHRKQISNSHDVYNMTDHFDIGQQLRVVVDSVNPVGNLALSMKHLERYPGESLYNTSIVCDHAEETLKNKRLFVSGNVPGSYLFRSSSSTSDGILKPVSLSDVENTVAGAHLTSQTTASMLQFENISVVGMQNDTSDSDLELNAASVSASITTKSKRASKIEMQLESLVTAMTSNEKARQYNVWVMGNMTAELKPLFEANKIEEEERIKTYELMKSKEKEKLIEEAKLSFASSSDKVRIKSLKKMLLQKSSEGMSRQARRPVAIARKENSLLTYLDDGEIVDIWMMVK